MAQQSQPFLQARAAFEIWSIHDKRKASCGTMIDALCEAGHRREAVEVFGGDLVHFIRPQ